MLPALAKMFALVRAISARREVTEIPASRWLIQRHALGPLCALAGASRERDELAAATVRWIALSREIPRVIDQLTDAGVAVAPIKGLSYATALYDVPAARPMTDVDLLVAPGHDARARRVLERIGMVVRADVPMHHASMWERDGLVIDLHRDILPTGRGRIALDDLWARTREGWPAGARRLDPVDELVFHLVHMVRNRLCGPLVHVVDAARLLERASADAARERAMEWKIEAGVGAALAYCRSILDETAEPWLRPPDDDVLFARQPNAARKLVFDVATAGSVRQLAARAIGAGVQWLTRSTRISDRET
jgi:hypothetical protein